MTYSQDKMKELSEKTEQLKAATYYREKDAADIDCLTLKALTRMVDLDQEKV